MPAVYTRRKEEKVCGTPGGENVQFRKIGKRKTGNGACEVVDMQKLAGSWTGSGSGSKRDGIVKADVERSGGRPGGGGCGGPLVE